MIPLLPSIAFAEPAEIASSARPPTLSTGNVRVEGAVDGASQTEGSLGLAVGLPRGLELGLSGTMDTALHVGDPAVGLGITALSTDSSSVVLGLGSTLPLGSELAELGAELELSVNLTERLILTATPGLSGSLGARESLGFGVPVELMVQPWSRLFLLAEVAAEPLSPSEGALGVGCTLGRVVLTDLVLVGHGSVAGDVGAGLGMDVLVPRR